MFLMAGSWCLWRSARRTDIIVAKTDPPLLSVMAAAIAKVRGARTINWVQDIFPEVAEALEIGRKPGGFAFRFLKRLRNWSLKTASMNVVVGTKMAAHLQRLGIPSSRTRVIANWSDGSQITPIPPAKNALRNDWGLQDSFVVGYAGNLGRAHDVDTLLDAMTVLHKQADASSAQSRLPIVFLFVGGGAQHAKLQREVAHRNLTNVQVRPYQARERLAEVLGVADVHVVSLNPSTGRSDCPKQILWDCRGWAPRLVHRCAGWRDRSAHRSNPLRFCGRPRRCRGFDVSHISARI